MQLAKEAYACEEKEERLVSDAVKHLTEANVQVPQIFLWKFLGRVYDPRSVDLHACLVKLGLGLKLVSASWGWLHSYRTCSDLLGEARLE